MNMYAYGKRHEIYSELARLHDVETSSTSE